MISYYVLLDWFRDCRFSDDSDFIANRFDKRLKPLFDDDGMNYQIQFGSPRDNDPELRVQGGMLEFDGYVLPRLKLYNPGLMTNYRRQIAGFFGPQVDKIILIINEIRNLLNGLKKIQVMMFNVSHGFLISPTVNCSCWWLRRKQLVIQYFKVDL